MAFGFGKIAPKKPAAFDIASLPGNFNALGGGPVVPDGVWDPVSERVPCMRAHCSQQHNHIAPQLTASSQLSP